MQKKIAVIGIGNTLRRDDGIGVNILESLLNLCPDSRKLSRKPQGSGLVSYSQNQKKECVPSEKDCHGFLRKYRNDTKVELRHSLNDTKKGTVEYFNFGIASFDLILKMRDFDTVLLIDGIEAGLNVGELKIFDLNSIKYDLKGFISSTHELNLKDIFELSKKFELKTKIYIAGIQIKDISYGEGLSKKLQNNKALIVKKISAFIKKLPEY